MSSSTRWAIYLRISRTDDRLGVERQLDLCRLQLAAMGVAEADVVVFDENNTSATKGVAHRPEYVRMLAEVRAGRIGGVMVYAQDRLARDTDELAEFLRLGVRFATSTSGEINLEDEDQFAAVEIAGVVAKREGKRARRRVSDNTVTRANNGTPHGRPPFGWDRDLRLVNGKIVDTDARWKINDTEAGFLRHVAEQLLRGISLRAVAAEANRGEVLPRPYTFGKGRYAGREAARTWSTQQLKVLLLRPSNAALRTHQGEVVGEAVWPPVLDRQTFDRVRLVLADPSRRSNDVGSAPSWLMSGIASCSVCPDGGKINVATGGTRGNPHYTCVGKPGAKGCFQRHPVAFVDDYIGDLVERRLADPDYGNAGPAVQAEIDALFAQIDAERLEQAEAGKLQAAKLITLGQLVAINTATDARVAELEARISELRPRTGRVELPGGWAQADLLTRRAVVRDLFERVELVPAAVTGKARRFETIADEVRAVAR